MNYLRYIASIIVIVLAAASCDSEDAHVVTGRHIRFTTDSDWPELTKAPVTDVEDINQSGFRVWGQWHPDPDNDSYYVSDDIVFGESGTTVTYESDVWVCEDTKEWFKGYYSFAAVLHPSQFSGTLTSSFSKGKSTSEDDASLSYSNLLSVDLPEEGLSLACTNLTKSNQIDFMYAFDNQDNSADQASYVNLHFGHAFSLLNVRLSMKEGTFKSDSILVKKVSLYGIHDSVTGKLNIMETIVLDDSTNKQERVLTNNFSELLQESKVSTKADPFYSAQFYSALYDVKELALVENLLVFPETLSKQVSLKILFELQCIAQSNLGTRELYAEINEGEWKAGVPNTYLIEIDSSVFQTE